MADRSGHAGDGGSSEIRVERREFEGRRIAWFWYRRAWWCLVTHAARAIDVDPAGFRRQATDDEMVDGEDYLRVTGRDAIEITTREDDGEFNSPSGNQRVNSDNYSVLLLSKSGLRNLLMRGRGEASRRMRKWLAREVLPSIEESGVYTSSQISGRRAVSPTLAALQQTVQAMVELEAKYDGHDERLSALENKTLSLPAGIGAMQLAAEAGWISQRGNPHNMALILACINAGFAADGRLYQRPEQGPLGKVVPAWYLTGQGVTDFYQTIDPMLEPGQWITIEPTDVSRSLGHSLRRYVGKKER